MTGKWTPRLQSVWLFFPLLLVWSVATYAGAETTADRVQKLFEQGWTLESRMHEDLAHLDQAIEIHEKALALAPDNEKAHWRLAEVLFKRSEEVEDGKKRKEMLERTVSLAEQALALNPDSVGGLYWAGTASARLADMSGAFSALRHIRQARTCLHQAIETDPDHRLSILSAVILALIYSESPWPLKDMDQAWKLADWAVEQDPDLTIASLSLGKIYLARNKTDLAEKKLKRCLATEQPAYIWDAVLYDWPEARKILADMK